MNNFIVSDMSKSRQEIMGAYPPNSKVEVWMDGGGWAEGIVNERVTSETMMGGHKITWHVLLKGEGEYRMRWVNSDPSLIRLTKEEAAKLEPRPWTNIRDLHPRMGG